MKKTIYILTATFLALSVSACSDSNKQDASGRTPEQQEARKNAFTTKQVKSPAYNITDYTKEPNNPPPAKP